MSLVPDGILNLPNSGPGLKIVEEAFIETITARTRGLMHWTEETDMVVRQHRIEGWTQHEHMFVTDVLLLLEAWGMSCYAVEHNTKQPTQLSQPTLLRSSALPISLTSLLSLSISALSLHVVPVSAHSVHLLWGGHRHQPCWPQCRHHTLCICPIIS